MEMEDPITETVKTVAGQMQMESNVKRVVVACFGVSGVGKSTLLTRPGSLLEHLLLENISKSFSMTLSVMNYDLDASIQRYVVPTNGKNVTNMIKFVQSQLKIASTPANKKSSRCYSMVCLSI